VRNFGADFPKGVNAPVSYGENIEALVAYFHARQYLPFARLKETLNDAFGVPISEGGVHCLLRRFAQKATPIYEMIKQRVQDSQVIGTDETGLKVNGCKHLFWTWQNSFFTYIAHSNNRGSETIDREFPEGFPQSVLVHDGWRAQIKTVSKYHQTCLPHLQRILNYLNQLYTKQEWGTNFIKLLYDAQKLKNKSDFQNKQYNIDRALIIQRFDFLGSVLENCRKKINRKARKSLHKGRKDLQSVYMITIF